MKIQNFLMLLAITLITFTSCQKRDLIRNGAVQIEFLEVPAEKQRVVLDSTVKFMVDFESKVQIGDIEVMLFVEDASKFNISNNGTLSLKEGTNLGLDEPAEDKLVFKHEKSVNNSSYEFEETVDLSSYAKGTIFVLRANANNDTTEGREFQTTFFQKENT